MKPKHWIKLGLFAMSLISGDPVTAVKELLDPTDSV
jgi:hypothetical protein